MKNILTIVAVLLTFVGFAQDPLTQSVDHQEMENWAEGLTNKYSQEIAMQEKQRLLFRNKLVEYRVKEEKIRNSDMPTAKKLANIQYNYQQETKDMADILTRPQLDLYKKLKVDYQPMEAVVVGQVKE